MKRLIYILVIFLYAVADGMSAEVLSLDTCRARALAGNKQIGMSRVKQEMAKNARKAARTLYLPHVDLAGGYMYSSRELSLLSDAQKNMLSTMGTTASGAIGQGMTDLGANLQRLAMAGKISPQTANDLITIMQTVGPSMATSLETYGNELGRQITDAFSTNTHHMFVASAVLTQPLFMGGVITASNKIADITERMAGTQIEEKESNITYEVDNAYWLVVSLRHKQMLATDYLALVQKLDDDVHKMIREGVATRADGLRVDVALNEAEMSKTKVDNALTLARMYLCQKCGMDVNSDITLVDEQKENVDVAVVNEENDEQVYERRRELKLLNDAIEISRQKTKIARAAYLPQLALMGGAIFTNPSVYNGVERNFKGSFNVGVAVRVPVLDWGENMYKIRAAKCATNLAQLTYDEAHDMIELQVAQSNFKVREANKKLITAKKNIQSAEENLRCANIGFKEGVMNTTDVMSAQTAWLKARTQKIDAEIDVKLSEIAQQKALGRN